MGFLEYIPIISALIFAGLLAVSLLQFSAVRKNMRMQSEQQIYARIMDARIKLENSEAFTKMAKESPLFLERFAAVSNPEEYYTVVAFLDLFEFLFRLNKTKTIDSQLWMRWKELAKSLMTIPKFKKVWEKTKQVHTPDFIEFIDSL
ncbi:MAG: hypothetical protein ACREBU_13910 [Nitrososphaera sp.]